MTGKDMIAMSQEDLKRLAIIHKVIDKSVTQVEAASVLDLSDRQIRRIVKRVRFEGNAGIVHKSRGKPSNRRLPEDVKNKVIKLYREKYNDFGPTFASEKLFEPLIKSGVR